MTPAGSRSFPAKGNTLAQFGASGKENGQFTEIARIACDPKNNDLYVTDQAADHVEIFTASGRFLGAFGSSGHADGQFNTPTGVAISLAGAAYVLDSGNSRVEQWTPGNAKTHTGQNIYYTAAANPGYPTCGEHPEWAGLLCETRALVQPGTNGLPELPETTTTYDIWDTAETTTEKFGATTRIKTQTYDAAGRALTSEVSSSADTPLPKVTNVYNEANGSLEKQSMTSEGKTTTITSLYNTLGQLEKYTDAAGVTSTYKYDIDGRIEEVDYGEVDHETASQSYAYDPVTGLLTKTLDTDAGSFTASYDAEGNMISQSYPNGMTATYTRNPAGETTGVEYIKTTHCASNCTWFAETLVPSIHGEALKEVSTLAEQLNYTYDDAGRLTEVQETVAGGKGCTTRIYGYDQDGNRTSLTTREPGQKGECATSGGTSEDHVYDTADRLDDTAITYDAFGNTTSLPASDANGHELKSSYYVDNAIATQEQEGKTIAYRYDPSGRTLETLASGSPAKILHYADPGGGTTWTTEGETWTRDIPGIDGTLCAIASSSATPILQLHDLQGNTVATASISETLTKPLSTYNSTEFGVPQPGTNVPKYAWLGAGGISTELPSSGVVTTDASSYVPEIGRSLQTEPVAPPGAFPNGTAGAGIVGAAYIAALNGQLKTIAVQHEAELEAAARREAEEQYEREHSLCAAECGHGEGNCAPGQCVTIIPEVVEGGAQELAVGGDEEASASGLSFGPAYCVFRPNASATYDLETGMVAVQFTTSWDCKNGATVKIKAAWNYYGFTPTSIYHTETELKGGVIITELETYIYAAGETPVGMCVAATHHGHEGSACWVFGDA